MNCFSANQEGLPAYWGIETSLSAARRAEDPAHHQEGLPAYWGIETRIR